MSDLAHHGQHADCFDCETVKCPDCCEGKHWNCFGAPCCCDCPEPEEP